jgi:hypothetical protein
MTESETLREISQALGRTLNPSPQPRQLSGFLKRHIQKTEGGEA